MNKNYKPVRLAGVASKMLLASTVLLSPTALMAGNSLSSAASVMAQSQNGTIKGTVVDENGEPMIGVAIRVGGGKTGVVTDLDGNFSVNAKPGQRLNVSYTGYKTQTVTAKSDMTVKLEPDAVGLEDLVVVGYGTQKKRDLTGAISSVKSEDITLSPVANPMEALQGRVAGLDITRESGSAGSGVNMQLRGNRTLSKNDDGSPMTTSPLFIIDGMPGDYSTLNPNDIESIEVLKDASSTAIYGSSGANGVVLITTKHGKEGKLAVNFNAYFGINGMATTPTLRNADEYVAGKVQAAKAAGLSTDLKEIFKDNKAGYLEAYKKGQTIDWMDEILHTGTVQNYSVSLSGGTERTQAYVSFNFNDEHGQYRDDYNKIYSTNMRVNHKVTKWLEAGASIQASYNHRNTPFAKMETAMRYVPLGTAYDENGNPNIYPIESDESYVSLLVSNKSNYRRQRQNAKIYLNPYIRVTPFKGFTWESRLNGTLTFSRSNNFNGQGSYNWYNKAGSAVNTDTSASSSDSRSYNYKWENILTYHFTVANDHDFTVTGVTSWNHNRSDVSEASGTGILSNEYLWYNLGNAVTHNSSSSYSMSKGFGIIGRVNYSYLGRYLASFSIRQDGASRLASDYQWATFPAFSLGWRISDEKFMESTRSWLDNLKLRVGYGETGSTAGIGAYASSSNLEQSYLTLGGERVTTYGYPKQVANKELTWERSKSWNIGIDAAFFNGRIELNADYYNTKTTGVIWNKQIPVTNGAYDASTLFNTNVNLAETSNQGVEITLNTRNIVKKDFKWNSTLTFAYNKEEITKLNGTENDKVIKGNYVFAVGSAVNSFYGHKLNGIWQKGEEADAACFGAKPGMYNIDVPDMQRHEENGTVYYTKVNEDGEEVRYDAANPYSYSDVDKQVLGHNSPDWTLGFQNTFKYKQFDLSIYMYMRWGQMIQYNVLTNYDPTGSNNFPAYFDIWSEDNPSNDFPAMNANITNASNDYPGFSSRCFVDGSFFKIKNITLGYTLPAKILKKWGMTNLRFYGTITNPLIIRKSHLLKGYDPEQNGSFDYPLTRQLVFGVNVAF